MFKLSSVKTCNLSRFSGARTNFFATSKPKVCLSNYDREYYDTEIQKALHLESKFKIKPATEILKNLWKKFPFEEKAYDLHYKIIVTHSIYGALTEGEEIAIQKSKYFPEKAAAVDQWFKEFCETNNDPLKPADQSPAFSPS